MKRPFQSYVLLIATKTLKGKKIVSVITLLKYILNVKHTIIEDFYIVTNDEGTDILEVNIRPYKSFQNRCPICGKKCSVYDKNSTRRSWRALDFAGVIVKLFSNTYRVICPKHGVKTAAVPWTFHDLGFTKDFEMTATYLAMNINKSVAAKYLRCDWHSIIRCISRVRQYLELDVKNRYEGLVNIGIDEISYKKGHSYLTVVVNYDTNTVVWCGVGHSMEVLSQFFEELTEKQRQSIKFITGDGAKWIDACMKKYISHATRCIVPFHVVCWVKIH